MLDVTLLVDLSGDRRPSGAPQRDAVQLWLDQQSERGGPSVRVRVRVRTVDVAGSEAKLLIELRRAAEEERADAVIVGTPVTPQLAAFAAATDAAALPVLLTQPVNESLAGRWIFPLAPSREELARRALDDAAARGAAQSAVQLLLESALSQTEAGALTGEVARRHAPPMSVLRVEKPDFVGTPARVVSVTSAFHVLGAASDAASRGVGPGLLAAAPRQGGPLFYLSYVTEPGDLGAFKDVATALWPASQRLLAQRGGLEQPTLAQQFVQSFTDRHGPPSAMAASAYDAIALLELAAERAGADDRTRLRDRLEELTFNGTATTYAFAITRHAGFAPSDLTYVRWSGSTFVSAALQ